jgi:hypothetical protein
MLIASLYSTIIEREADDPERKKGELGKSLLRRN